MKAEPAPTAAARRHIPWAEWVVVLLVVLYSAFFGWLAVMRHETFGSSAMDLGYTDQVVWNTLHGRFMQFSTLENALTDLPLAQMRRTDILLAYHVELLLVPLALLYLVWSNPLMLVLAQVAGVALGAWPAFLLAREHLKSSWAGVIFAAAYLLAPAIQGATLSDFHATSLTAGLFLGALVALGRKRYAAYWALIAVCLLAKEDISLLVCMLGGYLFLVRRERRLGLVTMGLGLAWLILCVRVILPHYNGLGGSPFFQRLAIFAPTPKESLQRLLADPGLVWRWLTQPEIVAYLRGLLASGGYLSLFSPLTLAIAAPAVAINVFSTWSWTYSGGEHYSAAIMPFVIASAIYGLGRVARWLSGWRKWRYERVVLGFGLVVLVVSGQQYRRQGIWPLSGRFQVPRLAAHERLGREVMRSIPPEASVSAQSNLYPHVSQRQRAYYFPAVNEADYVLLDASGVSFPLTVRGLFLDARQLMRSGEYGLLAAQDGYLLLQRGLAPSLDGELPEGFYSFARSQEADVPNRLAARFGDGLELLGYDYSYLNVVQGHSRPVVISTYWRALEQIPVDYQFALFFTRDDGAIVYSYAEGCAATVWYPPYRWAPGEVIRIETPVLTAGDLDDVLIAVVAPRQDIWQREGRLAIEVGTERHADLLDGGTLLRAFSLPR